MAIMVLGGGRQVRQRLLLGPDGAWREELWLDELLDAATPPPAVETTPPRPVLTTPLPVNTCSADSLTLLPGVGPVLADRIVRERANGGPFAAPGDLRRVRGIGEVLAARLGPLVIFGYAEDSCGLHDPR